MLKILHILHQSLPHHHSGYDIRSHYILTNQRALGIDACALTGPYCHSDNDIDTVDNVRYYHMSKFQRQLSRTATHSSFIPAKTGRKVSDSLFTSVLDKVARSFKSDIIHAHTPWFTAIPAQRYANRSNIPFVYEIRGLWEESELYEGLITTDSSAYRMYRENDTRLIRSADAVAVISEALKVEILKRNPDTEGKICVIPNGVDKNKFTPREKDRSLLSALGLEGKKVLGYFTLLRKLEGVEYLIHALAHAADDVVLLLIGDGPDRERLGSIAANLGMLSRVRFLQNVEHKDIVRYYSILDLFIVPRVDARVCQIVTPIKPLEAMAMGICVVASNVGGLSELIVDGKTGVLFQPGNSEDLAQKIGLLLKDNDLRSRIGRQASAFVREERTWEKIVSGYRIIYDRIVGKKSG